MLALALLWPGSAAAESESGLNVEPGDVAPFNSLCKPDGSAVVIHAFMAGGLELAQDAFAEQIEQGNCEVFEYTMWGEIAAINYIGFFHGSHLFAVRFGESGFLLLYFDDLSEQSSRPDEREA